MKTSIRFLAVVFAVAMMVLAFATVSANSFSDVTNETPHAKAIDSLTSLGIIHGYEGNIFKPDLPVRRDEMAKLVYTTFTTSTDAGDGVVTFPDVAKNSWAKGYISWCAGMEIVGGYEDGSFRPEGNVTYDEALKMVCAMLGYVDFNPEMWPIDVRLKALIDLDLGEGLEDVTGDATLTRAQVAQLFHNSLDEQMYVAPIPEEDKVPGKLQITTTPVVNTLAKDVWGYTETVAEVVATENWGLVVPYKVKEGATIVNSTAAPEDVDVRTYSKTNKQDVIKLRFLDTDGNAIIEDGVEKVEEVELADLGLEAYVGNTEELLTRCIDVFINREGEYTSATLKGKVVYGFTGAYSIDPSLPEEEVDYTHTPAKKLGTRLHKYGLNIENIIHEYENFDVIRKLVYLDSATCEALGYPEGTVLVQPTTTALTSKTETSPAIPSGNYFLDSEGNVTNVFEYRAWYGSSDPSEVYKKISFSRAIVESNNFLSNRNAIDADGDGYFEYVSFNYYSAYIVESISKKQIGLKSAYSTASYTYSADKFNSDVMPVEGDVIVGYFIDDEFFHVGTSKKITAFATKYNSTSTTLYGYATYTFNTSLSPGNTNLAKKVVDALINSPEMKPYVGFNSNIGDYNYANYYIYDGTIIYATVATADDLSNLEDDGQKRAILMYVDKPTAPQINEKTKQYEVFYPAYLIINGKEELVNLKPTNAIDSNTASMVAQDGSMYRAYVKDGYVMYRNMLVTYEVDDDGYYSLKTSAGIDEEITDTSGNIVEKIIAANGYYLTIDPSTKVMSIVDGSDNVIVNKIIAKDSSVIYYPYTKKTTGCHEYIGFYYGSEVPSNFTKIELIGDTYLTVDEKTGLFVISTTMVALDGFDGVGTTGKKDHYKTDARYHLIALADTDAVYDEAEEEVLANYYFQGIYEGTAVTGTNKEKDYSSAKKALTAGIYAWDEEEKDYVEVDDTLASFSVQNIEEVLADMSIIFTAETPDGLKLNETTKIVAIKDVPDNSDEEFLFEEITLDDLDTLLETIAEYNEINSASKKLEAKIGNYVDDEKKTQIAYIIVDWVEYDEELEAYTFAGEIN